MENAEQRLSSIQGELEAAEKQYSLANDTIHKARMKAARRLEQQLTKELKPLGMPDAEFSVSVELEEGRYERTGGDAVEFMLAPYPGEPLKAVKASASGGELSRVMLALKTVFAKADRVPILVFDEVDAGIGGRGAGPSSPRRPIITLCHAGVVVTHFSVAKKWRRPHEGGSGTP